MEALRASLAKQAPAPSKAATARASDARKPAKRAQRAEPASAPRKVAKR